MASHTFLKISFSRANLQLTFQVSCSLPTQSTCVWSWLGTQPGETLLFPPHLLFLLQLGNYIWFVELMPWYTWEMLDGFKVLCWEQCMQCKCRTTCQGSSARASMAAQVRAPWRGKHWRLSPGTSLKDSKSLWLLLFLPKRKVRLQAA